MAFLLRFYPQLWLTGVTGWLTLLPWSDASFFTISRSPFSYLLYRISDHEGEWESYLGSREPRIQMTLPPPPCPFKIYIQVPNDQFANWIPTPGKLILVGAWKHQLSCALLAELLSLSHLTLRPHDLQHSRLPCPSSPSLLKLMSIELMMPSNHLLLIPSFALSQHQDLFHWVGSSHEVGSIGNSAPVLPLLFAVFCCWSDSLQPHGL